MLYSQNLTWLCIFMRPVICQKKLGRNRWCNRKTYENEPGNGFFGLISWNFQDFIKNRNMPCTSLLVQISKEFDRIYLGE